MQIELGIAIAIGSFVIGYFTFSRNRDKDVRLSAAEDAATRAKLDYIGLGVDTISKKIENNEKRTAEMAGDIIRVDESTKQAHKRIDQIIGGGNTQ